MGLFVVSHVGEIVEGGLVAALDALGDPRTVAEWVSNTETADDAAFIATSRTLVPKLLDEVERLQKQLTPLDGSECSVITGARTFEKQIIERDKLRAREARLVELCRMAGVPELLITTAGDPMPALSDADRQWAETVAKRR